MFRPLLFVAAFFLLGFPAYAQKGDETCRWQGALTVHVVYEVPKLANDLSHKDIINTRRAEMRYMPQFEPSWPALVRYQPTMGVSAPLSEKKDKKGRSCLQVGNVNVLHGFKDVLVNIAREYPPSSCAYQLLWHHQAKHIKTHKQFLHDLEPEIRAAMEKKLAEPVPMNAIKPLIDQQYEWERRLAQVVKGVWDAHKDEHLKRQTAVDSSEEIAQIKKACGGEIGVDVRYPQ